MRLATLLLLCVILPPLQAQPLLVHVHGMAFSSDGRALLVSSHVGLTAFRDGGWSSELEAQYDFTGFSAARGALYASGHPAPGAVSPNPLGLARSIDGGRSWESIALAGEADFHFIAASYRSAAIYVVTHLRNSMMPSPGLYVTRHQGRIWRHAKARGLVGGILALAAHPDQPEIVAAATERGVYLSRDEGQRFRRIDASQAATAISFDFDGRRLWYWRALSARLVVWDIDGGTRRVEGLPQLGQDFVTHIAQHPLDAGTLAVATRGRDVHLSTDGGKSWRQIAKAGDLP